jgi:hypothetical protein
VTVEVLLAILLSILPAKSEAPRLYAVALDIWSAAEESPLYCGPEARLATSLTLAAVAVHESGLRGDVQDCSRCLPGSPWCDRGRSVSMYQLHVGSGAWRGFSREEICSDNSIATSLALRILERHRHGMSPASLFDGYARGARRGAAQEMAGIFASMARTARIHATRRDGCLHARRIQ